MMIAADRADATRLLAKPHHDGSDDYVLQRPDAVGGEAVVRLWVPRATSAETVALRYVVDGEPRMSPAEIDAETERGAWWRASFPVTNPSVRYRWLLAGGEAGFGWVNGLGLARHGVPDADDFVLSVDPGGPEWHLRSVVYEVFPDRFASSGRRLEPPSWAVPRAWDERPAGRGPETPFEWFGGDLIGLRERLDHLERLGASALYLTPVFPAGSTHRYDASSFDQVDPLLGGDDALAALMAAAHERGIHVIGDLTANHCGAGHPWFQAALGDPSSAERELFVFDEQLPHGYECWLGVASLPKLNWRSRELRRRMEQVVRRWLRLGLDGWRIDVANMAGRFRDVDLNAAVSRLLRRAVEDARPDGLLIAEHFHDFRPDLVPGGWHGVMNYAGFLRPVWEWLKGPAEVTLSPSAPVPRLPGELAVAAMRAFRAGVPWPAVLHSWVLLDSHDTARFRTVTGSRDLQLVGVGLQMTSPGVPMVFAGDEIGLEGAWGEDARRTMPWQRPESWDLALLDGYRQLIALRRSSRALARGGIRYVFVDADAIAYLRESGGERLLSVAARAPHPPLAVGLDDLACQELAPLTGAEAAVAEGCALLPADGPCFHLWRVIDG